MDFDNYKERFFKKVITQKDLLMKNGKFFITMF